MSNLMKQYPATTTAMVIFAVMVLLMNPVIGVMVVVGYINAYMLVHPHECHETNAGWFAFSGLLMLMFFVDALLTGELLIGVIAASLLIGVLTTIANIQAYATLGTQYSPNPGTDVVRRQYLISMGVGSVLIIGIYIALALDVSFMAYATFAFPALIIVSKIKSNTIASAHSASDTHLLLTDLNSRALIVGVHAPLFITTEGNLGLLVSLIIASGVIAINNK